MSRNTSSDAIILRNTPFGEIHKNVTMLTRNAGLVRSIAYGALKGKGKLRSLTSPFAYGTVYLYNDPVKDSSKITDMDVRSFFENIRENLKKFYTASLWAEIVLYSHGGGEDNEEVFDFLLESMQLLEILQDEREIGYCSVQFIFRYLKNSRFTAGNRVLRLMR